MSTAISDRALISDFISEFESAEEEASYTAWLQKKVAENVADPRPSVPHDEAMARIRRTIETAEIKHKQAGR